MPMFEAKLRSRISAILSPLAQVIVSIGITANMLTMFGLLVNLVAAYYLATERLVAAGLLILFGASFDYDRWCCCTGENIDQLFGSTAGFRD